MSAPRSPSGEAARPWAGPPWRLVCLIGALLVLRLIAAGALHLTEDEAYYRLWSMTPALGYYDHPPMIAWWIALGRAVAGDTPLGVRLLPAAGCALTSLLVFDLARLAGADGRVAERAAVWFNAMLLVAAGGFLAVPDAPAALFWSLTLWCGLKAARSSSRASGWWLAAGSAAGLATLSKYSALFLGPGMLIWLAWTPMGRRLLRGPGPWLALATAAALFCLNVGWNGAHHWMTFAKQFARVAPGRLAPRYLVEFVGVQALLLNPLIAMFAGRALVACRLRHSQGSETATPDLTIFWATGAPFIGYLIFHALHDRVQAHWPAPIYPAVAIIAAIGAAPCVDAGYWATARRAVPVLGLTVITALVIYLMLPAPWRAPNVDPAAPLRGWPSFAARLETLRAARGAAWVGTTSYGLAAELADEPALHSPVLQIAERARWRGLRWGSPPDLSRPGLIVDLPRRIDAAKLGRCFARVQSLGLAPRGPKEGRWTAYAVFLVATPARDVIASGCGP